MPAPIAPWMSASEALTIWMLSTAMKAPSVAPNTAIQVFAETVFAETAGAACGAGWLRAIGADIGGCGVVDRWLKRGHDFLLLLAEAGCIERWVSIIGERAEGLSGRA